VLSGTPIEKAEVPIGIERLVVLDRTQKGNGIEIQEIGRLSSFFSSFVIHHVIKPSNTLTQICAKSISSRVPQTVPQTASDRAFGGRVLFVSRLGDVAPQSRPLNATPKH
jgi:hypothetical protein